MADDELGFEPTADEDWGGKALVQEIVTRTNPYPQIRIEAVTNEEADDMSDLPVETMEISDAKES